MTQQFKEGEVYVDDETNAAYTVDIETDWNTRYNFKLIRKPSKLNAKHFDRLNYPSNLTNKAEELFINRLRPWQASDEPSSYDEKQWGGVKINVVYRNIRASSYRGCSSCLVSVLGETADYIMYWHDIEGMPSKDPVYKLNSTNHFKKYITRPAFPREIAGLKLPQMEGEI